MAPKDTAIAATITIAGMAIAIAITSVRANALGWRMQTYAGRASPSKIPVWIESHSAGSACKWAARTDPRDPDPDPGV